MAELKLHNLFFALWPDPAVRAELVHLQQTVSGQAGMVQHQDDLHVTLVFLGKVAPEMLECVRQAADGISVEPFALELTRTGYWKRPRILWCGPDQIPGPLNRLVLDLQQALTTCGFSPDKRDYRPHVTLVRKAVSVDAKALDATIVWRPHEFVLAGSHYDADRPRYRIMERWSI